MKNHNQSIVISFMGVDGSGKSYKYRIGFIGGGIDSLIGATHFRSIALHTKLELVSGVFSINKHINYKSAKVYNVPKNRVYTDIDTFLKKEKKLDAIVLITVLLSNKNK